MPKPYSLDLRDRVSALSMKVILATRPSRHGVDHDDRQPHQWRV